MSSPEVEEYTHKYLRDEPCGELACTVTEQIPLDRESGYSRKVVWQDTDELRAWEMELYDRKGSHLKTLTSRTIGNTWTNTGGPASRRW